MAGYNFEIEYIHGMDNKVADAISCVGERLDEEAVKELLDQGAIKELLNHAVHNGVSRAEADDPRVVEEQEKAVGERPSYRRKCSQKPRKTIKTWLTHSG